MKNAELAKLSSIERFMFWIEERNNIYLKRLNREPPPWTDNETLQTVFFTNPYRENDKVTKWFRKNIRNPMREDPRVLFATICFRWFTWIPTGRDLLKSNLLVNWNADEAIELLTKPKRKVFTAAFMISNSGSKLPKIEHVCRNYITPAWNRCKVGGSIQKWFETSARNVPSLTSMKSAHKKLQELPGMGGTGFMAYEVICDLRYTYLLNHSHDICSWSNPGPGAKRGLNRLLGRDLKNPCKDYQKETTKLLKLVQERFPNMPKFEMREVEHSLCENWKMERVLFGLGHNKRKYNGTGKPKKK